MRLAYLALTAYSRGKKKKFGFVCFLHIMVKWVGVGSIKNSGDSPCIKASSCLPLVYGGGKKIDFCAERS